VRWLSLSLLTVQFLFGSVPSTEAATPYCAAAKRTVAILMDRTMPYDSADRQAIEQSLQAIDRHVLFGTRIILQTIGEGFSVNRLEFDGCVPGCPDIGLIEQFQGAACVPVRANADRNAFRAELYRKLKELSETSEKSPHSDIARTIAELSRSLAGTPTPLAELVIFSDMIDNVVVGHRIIYMQDPRRTLEMTLRQNVRAELKGANVAIFGFGRLDIPPRNTLPQDQYERLRTFWAEWFKVSGAARVTFGVRLQ
jgi:hypothetical protein